MIQPAFEILNQRGTPMFFSDVFANRPSAGIIGRIFISIDTAAIYRDTGTTWDLIADGGSASVNIYNSNGTLTGNRVVSYNSNYLSFNGGQTFFGSQTTSSGLVVINNASSDAHLQVVGANAPSIRIDNAGFGATRRFVMGLATATNNFIQGATDGDICISTASSSPLLFGMWQTINASEVMRLTTANNVLIGSNIDFGVKLYVNGRISAANSITVGDGGTGLSRLFALSGSDLVFNAGGDRMVVRQTGNVGINTLSPAYQFQVNGSSGTIARITDGTNNLDFYAGSGVNDISATANLLFSTNTIERLRINSSGNIGVGLIPNASWFSSSRAIQVGSIQAPYLSLFQQLTSTADGYLAWGVYLTGDRSFSYITTGDPVSAYRQNSGIHAWFTAGSGVAGNNVSFTQAMTLTSSGNLLVGTSVDSGQRLQVSGAGTFSTYVGTNLGSGGLYLSGDPSPDFSILGYNYTNVNGTESVNQSVRSSWRLQFGNGGINNFRLGYRAANAAASSWTDYFVVANDGNVLIGSTTNQGQKLYLNGSLRIDGQTSGTAGGNSGQHLIINCDGTTYKIVLLNP